MNRTSKASALILWAGVMGSTSTALAQTTHNIAASGLTFSPANVTVDAGDSVHWTGLSGGFHTVAEVNNGSATTWNGGFHSAPGASDFTQLFNTPGTFYFICEPHVSFGMRGSVTVIEPVQVPTVSEWGLVAMVLLILSAGTVLLAKRLRHDSLAT